LFLVAYENSTGGDYDVWFTAVSPTQGQVGSLYGLTFSDDNLMMPKVACNQAHQTCLLAYEHKDGYIKGNYITLNSTGVQLASSTWPLANVPGKKPFLAWGMHAAEYFLAFTWKSGGGIKFPVYTHLSGTYPATNPYTHAATFLLDFTYWANDKYATGVAYDPCTQKFVVLFDYVYNPNPSSLVVDVWAAAVHKTGQLTYWASDLAFRPSEERGAGISFITADDLQASCGVMDKLVYTYLHVDGETIYVTDLRGNNDITAPHYRRDQEGEHQKVITFSSSWGVRAGGLPNISGGSTLGGAMLVYTADTFWPEEDQDYNVWGRIVRSAVKTYLPLSVR